MLGLEPQDFVVHHAGLHRAAAGRIDQEHDGFGAWVFKRGTQCGIDKLGTGIGTGCNFALDFNHRRVRNAGVGGRSAAMQTHPHQGHKKHQPRQPDKGFPAAGGFLLVERGKSQLFQRSPFPTWRTGRI